MRYFLENVYNILALRVPLQRNEAISLKNICSKYFILISGVLFLLLLLPGCGSFFFYTQAIHGQFKILVNRQPVDKIIDAPNTSVELKKELNLALDIRTFAIESLKLPGQHHYQTYVNVKQPYVAWAVFAAPQYSMEPKTWCYPIVGCAVYRGYFSRKKADTYAKQLHDQGYDVYVSGVKAYSTLGWFDDPILSTFIDKGKTQLAALIFHELAHHIFYVKDDSTFNESFAHTVEQEGLKRWFTKEKDPDAFQKYLNAQSRHKQFIQLITKYRHKLKLMYKMDIPISEKERLKDQIFKQLNTEYLSLKKKWKDFSGYDPWFKNDLNNAKMITVAAYNDLVPVFQNILMSENGDLERFYSICKDLSEKPKKERMALLNQFSTTK